ncbi:MarR family winged helix-turn-helix transcriptional regulator [Clostridium thermarum]|uniref:MarR family winged helix-turn-helix transcriptional regulator n=1 Tax=Clostridium thermarum TaxID=1716543 RepID=UPI0013D3E328|nr:hypothetical protein [Clostridium thermarum]
MVILYILENSTMSITVNNLVTSDLAKRDTDPQDRRYITISLTGSGHKLYESIEERMSQYFEKIFERIPVDKKYQVLESMQYFLRLLNKFAERSICPKLVKDSSEIIEELLESDCKGTGMDE